VHLCVCVCVCVCVMCFECKRHACKDGVICIYLPPLDSSSRDMTTKVPKQSKLNTRKHTPASVSYSKRDRWRS
jgi:hypothetical protein